MEEIIINGKELTLQKLINISRFNRKVKIDDAAKDKVKKSRCV